MLTLSAKLRKESDKKAKVIRQDNGLPAVLYGTEIENISLKVDLKEFEKIFAGAGESSLIKLEIAELKRDFMVLIHDIQKDPLTDRFIHADFYQPSLEEEIEIKVPLVFEGEALAVKDLGGTLIKNIQELVVKALPQDFPKEIKVNIESLNGFDNNILIKDLYIGDKVRILKDPEMIVAQVVRPEKVEEELEKPVEEKVEEVEKIETGKKEEVVAEEK